MSRKENMMKNTGFAAIDFIKKIDIYIQEYI
jgi:hypothetical protein